MPCRSDYDNYDDRTNARVSREDDLINEVNRTTRFACEALTLLEKMETQPGSSIAKLSEDTRKWWRKHKKSDKKRIQREEALKHIEDKKQAALNKLTPEEKKLLGLK